MFEYSNNAFFLPPLLEVISELMDLDGVKHVEGKEGYGTPHYRSRISSSPLPPQEHSYDTLTQDQL